MSSNNTMMHFRDVALQKISSGISIFNEHKDNLYQREQGYLQMVSGLEDLIEYRKQEPNQVIKDMVKAKIEQYLNQAAPMKEEIDAMKNKQSQDQIKSQQDSKIDGKSDKNPKKNLVNDTSSNKDDNDKFENSLREAIILEKPNVKWSDVAGLENAKKALHEAVILPIRFPHIFKGMIKPWRGILLYGPPGTGKTFLAKACATECDATFFSISSSDLISKWVGESEKIIKTLFKMAREKKPSVIFIDEIDSMAGSRSDGENESSRRVKTEFLVQMQGVGNDDTGVLVLGATNVPWCIDPAIRRRFEKRIMIPLPDMDARYHLFDNLLKKTPNTITTEEKKYLAQKTQGFSGSDISVLIRDASYEPLRIAQIADKFKKIQGTDGQWKYVACPSNDPQGESKTLMDLKGEELQLEDVSIEHFEIALKKCKPSVSEKDILKQEEFTREFGEEG